MQTRNRFFDDLAKVAGGAAGTFSEFRGEFEGLIRQRIERVAGELNLVSREEFDAIRDVATTARAEQERLEVRVAELEAQLKSILSAKTDSAPKASTGKNPAKKRTTTTTARAKK